MPIEYLGATARWPKLFVNKSDFKEKIIMSATSISSIVIPQALSTGPSTPPTSLQTYFKERRVEVQQLNEALKSGDLSAAQQAYNNIVALGNNELHKDNPFLRSDRGLDFNAIGGALQNGDLAGAQQAFAALQSTFGGKLPPAANSPTPLPAAVVNLSNANNAGPESALNSSNANGDRVAPESGVNVIV
jgi:hypothetical protein